MRPPKIFLSALLLVICLSPAAAPAVAGAESPAYTPVLAFLTDTARAYPGEIAVPVECEGARDAFCSGTVTLIREGRHASVPVSIQGGSAENVYVPLRLDPHAPRPVRVSATLITLPPIGGTIATKTILSVE